MGIYYGHEQNHHLWVIKCNFSIEALLMYVNVNTIVDSEWNFITEKWYQMIMFNVHFGTSSLNTNVITNAGGTYSPSCCIMKLTNRSIHVSYSHHVSTVIKRTLYYVSSHSQLSLDLRKSLNLKCYILYGFYIYIYITGTEIAEYQPLFHLIFPSCVNSSQGGKLQIATEIVQYSCPWSKAMLSDIT